MATKSLKELRKCIKCEVPKPLDEFRKFKSLKGGYLHAKVCKECSRTRHKAWCKENPDKVRAQYHENKTEVLAYCKERYKDKRQEFKAWSIQYNYGITVEDVLKMVKKQKGCCALCGKECKFHVVPLAGRGAKANTFVIDHCHKTGRVRGLLCNGCNVGVGLFKDCPKLLRKVIAYLQAGDSKNGF